MTVVQSGTGAAGGAMVLAVPALLAQARRTAAADRDRGHRNEVILVGRLSGPVRQCKLRSGAVVCSFALVVRRNHATGGASVDAVNCAVWERAAAVQRAVHRWSAGDLVEIRGALRRRRIRGVSGGIVSRCEIDVDTARRLATAAAIYRGAGRRGTTAAGSL